MVEPAFDIARPLARNIAHDLTSHKGVGVDPDAAALIARFTTPPSQSAASIINTRILALKSKGLWDTFDALYVLAAESSQAALQNWRQNLYNGTIAGSVTFTANVGMQGDGTTGYIDTGFNPATAVGPKFTQNSATIGFWSQTAGQANTIEMGNTNTLIQCRNTSDAFGHRVNAPSSGSVANVTSGAGLFVSSRTGPNAADNLPYRDGGAPAINTNPGVSQAPDSNNIRILGRGGVGTFSARQGSLAFIASGWTAQNEADFYAIFA